MSHHQDNYYDIQVKPYKVTANDLDVTVNYVNSQANIIRSVLKGGTGIGTYSVGTSSMPVVLQHLYNLFYQLPP